MRPSPIAGLKTLVNGSNTSSKRRNLGQLEALRTSRSDRDANKDGMQRTSIKKRTMLYLFVSLSLCVSLFLYLFIFLSLPVNVSLCLHLFLSLSSSPPPPPPHTKDKMMQGKGRNRSLTNFSCDTPPSTSGKADQYRLVFLPSSPPRLCPPPRHPSSSSPSRLSASPPSGPSFSLAYLPVK